MTTQLQASTRLFHVISMGHIGTHLLYALLVAAAILIACFPALSRSPWIDELMLFSNYPVAGFPSLFSPLPFYDQASPPLYSLFASLVAGLDIRITRSVSIFFIAFVFAAILIYRKVSWENAIFAFLSVTAFLSPLLMYSELKYYGLESVGVLISISWFIYKDPKNVLNIQDLAALLLGMFFGISTLIVSGVSIALFIVSRYILHKEITRKEISIFVVFVVAALLYYLMIKHITAIQIGNYPDAYTNKGALGNIKSLFFAVYGVSGKAGFVAVVSALVILISCLRNVHSQRLLIISISTWVAFLVVAALGVYPGTNSRHLNWSAAFFSALTFYGVFLSVSKQGLLKAAGLAVMAGLAVISAMNATTLWQSNFEKTENNQIISLIRSLPSSSVGLWIGGQPVIGYYSRIFPDLKKHTYFGEINARSAKINIPNILDNSLVDNFDETKLAPGAWGRMVIYRMIPDYTAPAKSLVSAAPRNSFFYILASHYNLNASSGYAKSRVEGLHGALTEAGCTYQITNEFKGACLYKAYCN